ncbi:PP2C family protein-serine/threonine phosphatase [Actibacterium ureilyticum]|uniref:PP2C family protein-serine/threonine phosphatase n=1 Tax=Actibacterium ureilyticum TaxID=1590614 RepID=UPI000BAAFBE9|nr:SpoIIE family protein phosphatase [Actibacterium ureilyticum]
MPVTQLTYETFKTNAHPPPRTECVRTVLLVDDSRVQRRILKVLLVKWGYNVIEAGCGEEAMEICRHEPIDFIISDWVMPGMSGLDFCTQFRALDKGRYGYFIVLTSKSETDEVVHGLEVGADDFLIKPINAPELRARLLAGERVLVMEQELSAKNQIVGSALAELQSLYDSIERDLEQARKIQDSLVPERSCRIGRSDVSMLMKPCGHVGGDLVGVFSPGPNRLGMYNIDVSGHGVTSALMTARIAGYLSGRFLDQNIALEKRFDRYYVQRSPEEVAQILNERLLSDEGVEEYFTMAYAVVDLRNGRASIVQAGHPHPVIQRADGTVEFVGTGGPPVGLLPDLLFESFEVMLQPGDRLIFHSDGITESTDTDGRMLEEDGLAKMLRDLSDRSGNEMLDDLFWQVTAMHPEKPMADDVSAIMLEYAGP